MRRLGAALVTMVLAGFALSAGTASSAAAPAAVDCAVTWGSLEKTGGFSTAEWVTDVRSGQHECYDRLVFDVEGAAADPVGYHVRYVDVLRQHGSGIVVPVEGGAVLDVSVSAPGYDPETGEPFPPLPEPDVDGYRTFRDFVFAGSFEGQTQAGLGIRARLPFRVFQTADHLVVDVAHTW